MMTTEQPSPSGSATPPGEAAAPAQLTPAQLEQLAAKVYRLLEADLRLEMVRGARREGRRSTR